VRPARDQPAMLLHEPCGRDRGREGDHARLAAVVGRCETASPLVAGRRVVGSPTRVNIASLDENGLRHRDGMPGVEIADRDRGRRGPGAKNVRRAARAARALMRAVGTDDSGRHIRAFLTAAGFAAWAVRTTARCAREHDRCDSEAQGERAHRRSSEADSWLEATTAPAGAPSGYGRAQPPASGSSQACAAVDAAGHVQHAWSTISVSPGLEGKPRTSCRQPLGHRMASRSARS
jgi:hypothetical protein